MAFFTKHTLYTHDLVRAHAFYHDALGWAIDKDGRCIRDGREIATIALSKAPPHVPSHWLPFFGVEDFDASLEQARLLGAQVRRLTPGREAIIVDPRGAQFGLCAGGETSSAFAWNELLTDEPDAASGFYAALGGFAVDMIDSGPTGAYRILSSGTGRVGGVMRHPAGLHPHWQPYLAVENVDDMTGRAIKFGATPYFAPTDQPGFGRWSAVDDPVGAGICFLQSTGL